MAVTMINPYLFYNGTASKALELYKSALGAKPVGEVANDAVAPAYVGTVARYFGYEQ